MNRVIQPSVPGAAQPRPISMDPRIRRRRIEVRRHEGRRRFRILALVTVMVLLSGAGWLAVRSPALDVDAVEVEGATRTPAEVIRRTAGLPAGAPMIDIDEGRAAMLLKALPWVEEARVERRWPGTVEIQVTERSPRAVRAL
ncbi:MAG: FtsQ-type POTRA domain-containing protein [Actinobacteria bacterium]|nr:FtsQ-type POTRA domain-containing protein [Actinomycetota bacterium]